MAAPALAVDWEAIKAHAIMHGPRDAARSFQIAEGTVMARCAREGWLKGAGQVQVLQPLPTSMQPKASNACKPAVAAQNTKQRLGERIWNHQARANLKGSRAMAAKSGEAIISQAHALQALGNHADKLLGWSKADASPALINISIGPQPQAAAPTVDVDVTKL